MRRAAAGLAATLLVVAGCGSGGDDDASEVTIAPGDAAYCDAFGALIVGPLADEATDARDPEVLGLAVGVTRALLVELVEATPPDLRPQAEAFAGEYAAAFEVWEGYGYDLVRVDAEATAEQRAVVEAFLAAPAGPATDPLTALEERYFDRCAAGVTLPEDPFGTTTTNP